MRKRERLAAAALTFAAMLWVGLVDYTDPTPDVIRLPIVGLAAVGLAWWVWRWTGKRG